jgi:hypothetical protein
MLQHYNYRAAHKATEDVYGISPDYTREGGQSIAEAWLDQATA